MRSKDAIRRRIMELCAENELSMTGLSTRCGVTQSTISNIISGRNNSTTVSTIQKICDGIGIDLPTFFDSDHFRNLEQEVY